MKQADLRDVPKKGFTKKWWRDHRSRRANGSGVGKALDAWNAANMPPKGRVAALDKSADFAAAFAACDQLKTALDTAMGKVRGKSTDTADAVQIYLTELAKHRKALQAEYNKRVLAFKSEREKLVKYCADALKQMDKYVKVAKKIENEAELLERSVNAVIDRGEVEEKRGNLERLAGVIVGKAQANLDAVERQYATDGPYVKERRGGKFNADTYGVMQVDNKKLAHLLNQVVTDSTESLMRVKEVQGMTAETLDAVEEVRGLLEAGARSLETSTETAQKTCEVIGNLVDEFEFEAGRCKETFRKLGVMAEEKAEVESGLVTRVKAFLTKVSQTDSKTSRIFKQAKTIVDKTNRRIPSDHQSARAVKPHIDRYQTLMIQLVAANRDLAEAIVQAKKDAKTSLQA